MDSIHGHEVITFIKESKPQISRHNLEIAISKKFGSESIFHTCVLNNLSAADLIAFLERAGKLVVRNGISYINSDLICDDE
ncbi:YecH family protein [Candidatus Woesearchaeota archaeon]|nr:YecH family protein [Candidatus Woesearchaeota archaeon]